jgi:H+-transporting ATPase|uniref:Plasma-membrane proton-efflux P-type ATPase n=1 Tax=Fervidicoccus fontis TaxID=683846 RepID=A0A7J3SL44_9CREN
MSKQTRDFEKIPIEKIFELLGTNPEGLTEEEAEERLRRYGPNAVEEKKENSILEFLKRFWGPMPWLLEIAILLSLAIGHKTEAAIIASLLVINAVIGFKHQQSSKKVLESLKSRLAPKAKVFRNGVLKFVDSKLVVPGDILVVELGDIVPADCKIIEGDTSVDQSALTGESLPVEVSKGGILYSGSIVKGGRAKCVVLNTGKNTYFGRTAELVKVARPKSHQQEVMLAVTKYSMYMGLIVMVIASIFVYLSGLKNGLISILTFDVAILMGCVPVALPAVMTIMQAAGARELAKKGVLVSRLDAVEDAASVDVLCLDKTGTITTGELEVTEIISFGSLTNKDVIELALYASAESTGDPIDSAIFKKAKELGVQKKGKQLSFKPFDPSLKRTEGLAEINGLKMKIVKGAPQIVERLCSQVPKELESTVEKLAERGLKTLLVAYGEEGKGIVAAGLIALSDPPRPDSPALIKKLKELYVRPKMLTGDSFPIAREISVKVGIGEVGYSLQEIRKSDAESREFVEKADFIAEVYPEDKYEIVKILQEKGHMVGMTGDGVNDAPALKQAELGIAVSNATDVAKSSAGMVLLTSGLRGIVDAIMLSREVYQRALTWIINKVTKVIQFTLLLVLGLMLLHYDVLTLMGMALLIFANDFATMSLSTDNAEPSLSPNKWNIKNIMISSSVIGVALLVEALLSIYLGLKLFAFEQDKMQSFILLLMVFTSQFRVLIVRERRSFWSSKPGRELMISVVGVILTFAILGVTGIIIAPIPASAVLFSLVYSAAFTFSLDPLKVLIFKKTGLL